MSVHSAPVVTLTTDFGEDSPYVAAMKGVLLSVNPAVRILDLSHRIPPQDIRHAAFFLAGAVPYFPTSAIHVVVVDPGVGSARALLYVELEGHRLLAPDNGCWTELARGVSTPSRVVHLAEPQYWRSTISATFHGRDILAPVAGHLSLGVDPSTLGPEVQEWVRLDLPAMKVGPDGCSGEVIFVDSFGNLITNLPAGLLTEPSTRLFVGNEEVMRRVRTYADSEPGTVIALQSSTEMVEVAMVQGSAAARLQAGVGTPVYLRSA